MGSSSEDTEDVEIPNVDDALQNLDTSTTSGDMGLNEKDIVNPAKGDAFIPPVHCSANPPVATSVASLPEGDATRVIEETTAPTTPFVNSSILDSEASDGLHSTIGCAPPPCLADMESYVREYDNESALSSHAKFVEHFISYTCFTTPNPSIVQTLRWLNKSKPLMVSVSRLLTLFCGLMKSCFWWSSGVHLHHFSCNAKSTSPNNPCFR